MKGTSHGWPTVVFVEKMQRDVPDVKFPFQFLKKKEKKRNYEPFPNVLQCLLTGSERGPPRMWPDPSCLYRIEERKKSRKKSPDNSRQNTAQVRTHIHVSSNETIECQKKKFVDWERSKQILGRENWFPPWGSSTDRCSPFFAFYFFFAYLKCFTFTFCVLSFHGSPPPPPKKKSTVTSCIEAALELKPHFLQTQVVHKPHLKKTRSSCRRCRTKSYHFSHAKMFVFFWTNS